MISFNPETLEKNFPSCVVEVKKMNRNAVAIVDLI